MVGVEPLHEDPGRSVGPSRVKDNLHHAHISEPFKRGVDGASPYAAFSAGNGLKPGRKEVGSEPFQRGDVEGFLFHFVYPNRGASFRRDVAPPPGEQYVYRVKALRGEEKSPWSNPVRVELAEADPADLAPTNLFARFVSGDDGAPSGVALSWDAPAEYAASVTGYRIMRAVGNGRFTTLAADTGSTDTAYIDASATEPGETYSYRVVARRRGEVDSQPSAVWAIAIPTKESVKQSLWASGRTARPCGWRTTIS